jgi:hypothetical protein
VSTDLEKLGEAVEREMLVLHGLPPSKPRPECLALVKATVLAESVRVVRRRHVLRLARIGGVAAAAAFLVAGWTFFHERPARHTVTDADAQVTQWAAALDESDRSLTRLTEYGWTHGEFSRDEDAESEGLLQSLDQSFEHFGAL